jgi:hypothetical protein
MSLSPPPEGVLPAGADTLLTISSFGNLIYQARGLTQTLAPIAAAQQMERTINGTLTDISATQFRKYTSKISVPDEVEAPPFDGIWPGMEVIVDCAVYLCYPVGRAGSPARNVVSGSSYTENGMVFYRPSLTMLVRQPDQALDEWARKNSWNLELEEV